MPLSLAVANGLAQHLCGNAAYTAPSSPVYLALLTGTIPTQATSMATLQGQEPTFGGSYARVAVAPSTDLAAAVISANFANIATAVTILFPAITSGGEVITGVALVENSSGTGGRWFFAAGFNAGTTYTLVTGNRFSIASGQVLARWIGNTTVGVSGYAILKLLDLMTGKTAWASPTPWVGMCNALNTSANTATEVAYTGYARTTLSGVFGAGTLGVCKNTAILDMATNTGGSTAFTNWAMWDASTTGNLLAGGAEVTSPLAANATPRYSAATLSVSVG